MEFNEKIQELRKKKGLTQEELAEILFVSRTAVSKWESGRGYPNIDSLKAIARFFEVTIDELLSGDELLTVAEENTKEKENHFRDMLFGLLDCSMALLFFLPFFGQKTKMVVQGVPLLALTDITPYLRISYFAVVIGITAWGISALALQNCDKALWVRNKRRMSLTLSALGALLFIMSRQPYAAAFVFAILTIKVSMLIKSQ